MINRTDGMVFFVAGINYRKCDTEIRGQFALNTEMITKVLQKAQGVGVAEALILSTCNRTEIYGLTSSVDILIDLLCSETAGTKESFRSAAYIKKHSSAAVHLFEVSAGLDSQILGDYEIVGQLKNALKVAKLSGMVGSFLDRLVSSALQASKEIKNNTGLSGGTLSVSFAAVQTAKNIYWDLSKKKILLIGTGKIGRNTCKNLVDYGGATDVTLINRNIEKAKTLADEFGLQYGGMESLDAMLGSADIIFTATSSTSPIIYRSQVDNGNEKLIIDLSVPVNVSKDVEEINTVRLIRVDELSKMKDDTLLQRSSEIPKAKAIIGEYLEEFMEWNHRRRYAPMLNHLKTTLYHLRNHPHYQIHIGTCTKTADIRIKRVLSDTARKLEIKDAKGCHFISALNQFIH
jgi:glutamyl-tRNA reductase